MSLVMTRAPRPILVQSLNSLLQCRLCYGYLIEPTTLIDCFHTFCYSCIVRFILVNDEKFLCPICGSRFNSNNPLQSLCHDKILQSLIFKIVPNLYKNEKERRLEFYKNKHLNHPIRLFHYKQSHEFFANFDQVTLSLRPLDEITDSQRFLRCSMFTRIAHLMKLLKFKFLETGTCNVQIVYLSYIIPSYYRIIDFMYVFQNELDIRSQPIEIFYRLKEPEIAVSCPVKRFSDFSAASSSISSPSSISSYSSSDDYVYKSKKRNRRRKKSTKNKTKTFHAQAFCSSDLKLKLKLTQKPLHRKKRRKRSNDTTLDAILKKKPVSATTTSIDTGHVSLPIWQTGQVIESTQFSDLRVCAKQTIMTAVQSQIVRMIPNPSLLIKQQREVTINQMEDVSKTEEHN